MEITDEMLRTAITKAVEAGMLPRRALREEFAEARQLMRDILAPTLASAQPPAKAVPGARRLVQSPYPVRHSFPAVIAPARAVRALLLQEEAHT